ncbi:Asp23/Gls24 family envelope stress response protein [Brevibacillus ginsengisoli]|uniref:Asp23/Gls24 family envelope stress response protein n=1 Tax=Brevibacillus ginsengisoli TaxID=363854 RepID=UPI003CEE15B0
MESRGQIHVADQVVAMIAGVSANEIPGVLAASGGIYEDLTKIISRKTPARGIEVRIYEDYTVIDMRVKIMFGMRIDRACRMVQEKVKEDVETFTGLQVREVNIRVEGIILQTEEKIEQSS